jgi:hypothetical protein
MGISPGQTGTFFPIAISYNTVIKIASRLRQKLNAKGLPDQTRNAAGPTRRKSSLCSEKDRVCRPAARAMASG